MPAMQAGGYPLPGLKRPWEGPSMRAMGFLFDFHLQGLRTWRNTHTHTQPSKKRQTDNRSKQKLAWRQEFQEDQAWAVFENIGGMDRSESLGSSSGKICTMGRIRYL